MPLASIGTTKKENEKKLAHFAIWVRFTSQKRHNRTFRRSAANQMLSSMLIFLPEGRASVWRPRGAVVADQAIAPKSRRHDTSGIASAPQKHECLRHLRALDL